MSDGRIHSQERIMRAVVQRVARASVKIDGIIHGAIAQGMVIFLGIRDSDDE